MASAHRVRALLRQSRLVSIPNAVRFETAQVQDPQTTAQGKWPTAAGAVGGTVQEIFEQPAALTQHVENVMCRVPEEAQRSGELDALDDSRRATSSGSLQSRLRQRTSSMWCTGVLARPAPSEAILVGIDHLACWRPRDGG